MTFARIMMLIVQYGPLVKQVYDRIKQGADTHPEHAELEQQVRHWIEVADDVLHYCLERLYPGPMVYGAADAVSPPEMQASPAVRKELAEFEAMTRTGSEAEHPTPGVHAECQTGSFAARHAAAQCEPGGEQTEPTTAEPGAGPD